MRCLLLLIALLVVGCPGGGGKILSAQETFAKAAEAWVQDDPQAAERLYTAALQRARGADTPAHATALAAHGDFLLRRGDVSGAREKYSEALDLSNLNQAAIAGQGDALLLEGEFAEARNAYESAIGSPPTFAPAITGLGMLALAEGKTTDAVEFLTEILTPDSIGIDASTVGAMTSLAVADPDYDDYLKTWLEIYFTDHPDDLRARVLAGDYYDRTARPAQALAYWEQVALQRPDYPGLTEKIARGHFGAGHMVEAVKGFEALQASEPTADHLHLLAIAYANLPDFDAAVGSFRQGQMEYPGDMRFPIGIGQVLYQQGQYDEAWAVLEPLKDDPNATFQVYRELGLITLKRGDLAAADGWLAKAETLAPGDAWIHFTRGYLAATRDDREGFAAHLQHVLDAGYVTADVVAEFDTYEALMAIEWAAEWLDAHLLITTGDGPS